MLYKYPQREFPYAQLVEENSRRKGDSSQPEFELLDTGIFNDDRYFDVFVEYAKAGRKNSDACDRPQSRPGSGDDSSAARNCGSKYMVWKPTRKANDSRGGRSIVAEHGEIGAIHLHADSLRNDLPHPPSPQGEGEPLCVS